MDDCDLLVLAQRLEALSLEVPWTRFFACLLTVLAKQDQERRTALIPLRGAGRGRYRVLQGSWLWPCNYIPGIEAALKNPSPDRLPALPAFFQAVAVVHHLQAGRKLRKELRALFPGALPFTLVALAYLARRPRSLTPRPPAEQAKDISDVECRVAWHLWRIAETVHQELAEAFAQHGIGKVCTHCGRLFVDLGRSYCSDSCRKAYHDDKLYRRKQSKSRAG